MTSLFPEMSIGWIALVTRSAGLGGEYCCEETSAANCLGRASFHLTGVPIHSQKSGFASNNCSTSLLHKLL